MLVSERASTGLQAEPVDKHPFVAKSERNGWTIIFPTLPGCTSFASSWDEIGPRAHQAASLWIEMARKLGREIPDPNSPWSQEQLEYINLEVPSISVKEVAERFNVSVRRVQALATKRNVGKRYGQMLMFTNADLKALVPGSPGRPKVS